MPSVAYSKYRENITTVQRLLVAYDELKQVKNPKNSRGKMALDHITRPAVVFLISAAEVYIEDLLIEAVNVHIEKARRFENLPVAIKDTLNANPRINREQFIQKYRRLIRFQTNRLNTPWNELVGEIFHNYINVPIGSIEMLPNFQELKKRYYSAR